jgi:hypothetical protein
MASASVRRKASNLAVLLVAAAIILGGVQWVALANSFEAPSTPGRPTHSVEIVPQIDLLAAVQSQTTWMKKMGPTGQGNEYFQALRKFIEPYKDHKAVKICQRLLDRGFSYDAPVNFALHLGPFPDLLPWTEYHDYIVQRAGGREILEEFRVALRDLAQESKFMDFVAGWSDRYAQWIVAASADLDLKKVTDWLSGFFGWECQEFHAVLSPGMFRGSYGPRLYAKDGSVIAYEVIGGMPDATASPVFSSTPKGLERLSIHEIGHSFVNPTLEKHAERVSAYEPLFRKVESQMVKQAYSNVSTFFNEQVLRAVTAIASRDLYGEASYASEITYNEERGFYLTRFVAEVLAGYTKQRDKYPKFTDFVPVLLDRINSEQLQRPDKRQSPAVYIAAAAVVTIGAVLALVSTKKKRGLRPGGAPELPSQRPPPQGQDR